MVEKQNDYITRQEFETHLASQHETMVRMGMKIDTLEKKVDAFNINITEIAHDFTRKMILATSINFIGGSVLMILIEYMVMKK